MKKNKKVLILGFDACAYTLSQILSSNKELEIYAAPGNDAISEFANIVDIRDDKDILEFVLENGIDLTVVTSYNSSSDIAELFQSNNQLIFCPDKNASLICDSKIYGKKFMHKNKIPCPKFADFDKPNFAYSYLESANYPVVIKTEFHQKNGVCICNNIKDAKKFIDAKFNLGENRIIIEDYKFGHEFSFYVITDGYQTVPLGCVATYKYELDGNEGSLSSGMGAFCDNYRISNDLKGKIMDKIINPTLDALANSKTPYIGILGVDLVIDNKDEIYSIEYNSFLKSPDAQVILELIDDDIYKLFESCAIGAFADDYEYIRFKDEHAISCVLCSKNIGSKIEGLENLDDKTSVAHNNTKKFENYYKTNGDKVLILTRKSKLLSRAIKDLYEEIDIINFDGKKYRKDIGVII